VGLRIRNGDSGIIRFFRVNSPVLTFPLKCHLFCANYVEFMFMVRNGIMHVTIPVIGVLSVEIRSLYGF